MYACHGVIEKKSSEVEGRTLRGGQIYRPYKDSGFSFDWNGEPLGFWTTYLERNIIKWKEIFKN